MSIFVDKKKEEAAVRPMFFKLPTFVRDEEAVKKGLTDEERVLGALGGTEYWQVLKGRIDRVIEELEEVNESAIAAGVSLEEIGKNTIVTNLTKGVLKRVFTIIEDAKEAVENGK